MNLLWRPARFFLLTICISAIMLTVYINYREATLASTDINSNVVKDAEVEKLEIEETTTTSESEYSPKIYVVTPTYTRATQMADMTRLSQTLRLVPNIHWIVVEDSVRSSTQLATLLANAKIEHTYILGPTPGTVKLKRYGKGVASRRKALDWVRANAEDGVLYFADDDNSYDIRVFEEMRPTKKVSVWPVGLIFGYGMSTPIVINGKVIGFHDSFIRQRVFAMDMAGFAVSVQLLKEFPNATMEHKLGYLEDSFLRTLNVSLADLEPKAKNCTEVLVWHTKTVPVGQPKFQNLRKVKNYNQTNLLGLYRNVLPKWKQT